MDLLLVRHALAEDRSEFAKTKKEDHLRPIVEKGRLRFVQTSKLIAEVIGDFQLIVTSPYLRAKQSADILATYVGKPEIQECSELIPQAPPTAFVRWLRLHSNSHKKIAVVGHEPHLGVFISYLLTGNEINIVEMKKSGFCWLETSQFSQISPQQVILKQLVHPKFIR